MDTQNIVSMTPDSEGGVPDLDSYIQQAQFQTADSEGNVITEESFAQDQQTVEQGSQPAGNDAVLSPDVQYQAPDLTNQAPQVPQPDPQVAQLQRANSELQATIRKAALANLAREEATLRNAVKELSEPEQRAAFAELKARRAQLALNIQQQHQRSQYQQQESVKQQSAKNQVAYLLTQHYQLPQQEMNHLLQAGTPEQMEFAAQTLYRGYALARQAQQPQQAQVAQPAPIHPNARVAGGHNASTTPVQEVNERSGDILGLIQSRAYYAVEQSR